VLSAHVRSNLRTRRLEKNQKATDLDRFCAYLLSHLDQLYSPTEMDDSSQWRAGVMEHRRPRVSVGLPVYNGEEFLEEALGSLLAQTYRDFELIICDNASTDRTEAICRRCAADDSRVRYSRNSCNIGGNRNATLTFQLSSGEYFRFAGYDDLCAPTYLERLVHELDKRPEMTLCCTGAVLIDGKGNELDVAYPTGGTAARPSERFRQLALTSQPASPIYGLIRSDILRQTGGLRDYTGSDFPLLCDLALHGPFYLIPEPLFFSRRHSGNVYRDTRARMAWSRPELAKSGRPTFPNWLALADYIKILQRAPISRDERVACFLLLGRWMARKWPGLGWDVAFAVLMLAHSKEWRRSRYGPEYW